MRKTEDAPAWAAAQYSEITLVDLKRHSNPEASEISEAIYYLVITHTHGEALEMAKQVRRGTTTQNYGGKSADGTTQELPRKELRHWAR